MLPRNVALSPAGTFAVLGVLSAAAFGQPSVRISLAFDHDAPAGPEPATLVAAGEFGDTGSIFAPMTRIRAQLLLNGEPVGYSGMEVLLPTEVMPEPDTSGSDPQAGIISLESGPTGLPPAFVDSGNFPLFSLKVQPLSGDQPCLSYTLVEVSDTEPLIELGSGATNPPIVFRTDWQEGDEGFPATVDVADVHWLVDSCLDGNVDGEVNVADLQLYLGDFRNRHFGFGRCGTDRNFDGTIDVVDLLDFLRAFRTYRPCV